MAHAQSTPIVEITKPSKSIGDFKRVSLADKIQVACADEVLPREDATTRNGYQQGKAKHLLGKYGKRMEDITRFSSRFKSVQRKNIAERVATLGSDEKIYVYSQGVDCGLFASVLTAYNYHWTLRTSPDDWWFCVIKQVANAIDTNSKKDSVRKMFVEHEGKKTLEVRVNSANIYDVDYSWFFDEMAKQISQNIKVPEYVDAVTADFSSTTAVQKIVSQVTLMSSVQEYFEFSMRMLCGIPAVEMLGTEEDWKRLQSKLKILRTLLEPIENDIGLRKEWWALVENVFGKLLVTYQGKPDKAWWSHIMSYKKAFGSGAISGWEGWIVEFLEGMGARKQTCEFTSGLVTVPLHITDPSGVKDTAALVAGMLGFTVHQDEERNTSVEPFQGWSLMLPENSPFRIPLAE